MLEVKPNKEVLKIKYKILGFTSYQFFMICAGLISGTILFLFLPFHQMINAFILSIVVLMFVSLAMININNMNLFVFILTLLKNRKICKKPYLFENRKER